MSRSVDAIRRRPALLEVVRLLRRRTWHDAVPLAPVRDYVRLLRLLDASHGVPGAPVKLQIVPLGMSVWLRPGTTDVNVLFDTIRGFHLPPEDLEPRLILDLGSNIGLTVADLAARYPDATVIGVEPVPASASMARWNTAAYGDRCRIIEAAAWHEDTSLQFEVESGNEYAGRLASTGTLTVEAVSLRTLLRDVETADYVKLDIEGAEEHVLERNADWAEKVRCVKVETHPPYTLDRCADALARLGFRTSLDPDHTLAVIGRRD
jgi:FkbM family methyltransferase